MKVSVIMPVYNVEAYVGAALESVCRQSLEDLELLCISDAGSDGSWEIVKKAAAEDDRIRLLENERNLGLAATRNRGLDAARGEYVYFLDSDDCIVPHALEELVQRAEAEQLEVQAFASSFLYESRELEDKFRTNPEVFRRDYPDMMTGRDLFIAWMEVWDWVSLQQRYFYSRNFLKKNGIRFTEGMLHEDELFTFDVLMKAKRVRVWNDAFFIRRFRENSIMTGHTTIRNVEACVRILEKVSLAQSRCRDDPKLSRAVAFYLYKLFCDAVRKYRTAAEETNEKEGDRLEPSKEMRADAAGMTLFHMVEAFGLWEEKT